MTLIKGSEARSVLHMILHIQCLLNNSGGIENIGISSIGGKAIILSRNTQLMAAPKTQIVLDMGYTSVRSDSQKHPDRVIHFMI